MGFASSSLLMRLGSRSLAFMSLGQLAAAEPLCTADAKSGARASRIFQNDFEH